MDKILFLDSHTGGEPTRLILDGFPDLSAGSMTEKLAVLKAHDRYRAASASEPRASDVVVGAVLTPPTSANAISGVIFFNNVGYLGMCGHGTIGVITSLAHLGRIGPGVHYLDTPVGQVSCRLHDDGRVSVRNVTSYRYRHGIEVVTADGIRVTGDVAWGGNWFYLTDGTGEEISQDNLPQLQQSAVAIRSALERAGITGADSAEIDHIEIFSVSPSANSRNFVLCPGNAYDRSPCGTGTSAKLACLAADGLLGPGQVWVQESVIGSRFEASFEWADPRPDGTLAVAPTITGRAHVCAEGQLLIDPTDEFAWGIV